MIKNPESGLGMNYQKELDKIIEYCRGEQAPRLLLHSCCAPCSSYVLEYLSNYFEITIFYYNPNIYPEEEYKLRIEEQKTLLEKLKGKYAFHFQEGTYDKDAFFKMAKGLEEIGRAHV